MSEIQRWWLKWDQTLRCLNFRSHNKAKILVSEIRFRHGYAWNKCICSYECLTFRHLQLWKHMRQILTDKTSYCIQKCLNFRQNSVFAYKSPNGVYIFPRHCANVMCVAIPWLHTTSRIFPIWKMLLHFGLERIQRPVKCKREIKCVNDSF